MAADTDYPIHLKLVTDDVIEIARKKLTASEQLILLYIQSLNPLGDRPVEINPVPIMEQLEISRATYYRAIAHLQELGMLEYTPSMTKFKVKLTNF